MFTPENPASINVFDLDIHFVSDKESKYGYAISDNAEILTKYYKLPHNKPLIKILDENGVLLATMKVKGGRISFLIYFLIQAIIQYIENMSHIHVPGFFITDEFIELLKKYVGKKALKKMHEDEITFYKTLTENPYAVWIVVI